MVIFVTYNRNRICRGVDKSIKGIVSKYAKIIETFLEYYCKVVDKSAKEINELLVRATKLSAVRLIQSAYEMLHSQIDLNNLEVYNGTNKFKYT